MNICQTSRTSTAHPVIQCEELGDNQGLESLKIQTGLNSALGGVRARHKNQHPALQEKLLYTQNKGSGWNFFYLCLRDTHTHIHTAAQIIALKKKFQQQIHTHTPNQNTHIHNNSIYQTVLFCGLCPMCFKCLVCLCILYSIFYMKSGSCNWKLQKELQNYACDSV